MTPEVIASLQALVGRELTSDELATLEPLVQERNDVAIAAVLSVGRVRLESRMLTERGVLSALGAEAGDSFLAALEAITSPASLPAPLQSKFGAIRRAVGWLGKDGIDVSDRLTRGLLDALAATGVIPAASAQAIKTLAERPDPLSAKAVTDALGGSALMQHAGIAVGDAVRVLAPFDTSFPGRRVVESIVLGEGGPMYRITGGWEMAREHLEAV